ncbi:MAG: type II secretion system F family protein [Candidatus Aenigmatarchaeota archaeon]
MKIEKKFLSLTLLNVFFAISLFIINYLFFKHIVNVFMAVNIFALIISVLPIILWRYLEYRKLKVVEAMFPAFLRDFIELMRGGMTVEQAMKNLKKNDYKDLSFHVKRMAAQLDWGIPVDKVLMNFANSTKSTMIKRTIASVIESHRFGGNLADTLEALSNASIEVERLKVERSMYLYSQITTGYIIFFVFLGVMIAMGRFLIPSLTGITIEGVTQQQSQQNLMNEYKNLFMNLVILQGFFAGLAVGKMAEGSLISGVKHSLVLVVVGLMVFMIFG